MPKAAATIPLSPFHNLPAGAIADQLGALKAEIAELQTREKALRDELLRRGETDIDGAMFHVAVADSIRWTLDANAVRAEMGEAWWNVRCRQSPVTTVTVKPLVAAARLAA